MRQGFGLHRGLCTIALCGVCCLYSNFAEAVAESSQDVLMSNIRNHGLYLDEKNKLKIEESDGWTTVILQRKARAAGGPQEIFSEESGEVEPVIRFGMEERLVRMRSEVLVPAEPNYIRNPGQRYRISIEGIEVAPHYARVFEVDAADALDAVTNEFRQLQSYTDGPKKLAMYYGGLLSMRALNESGRIPAVIPITVLRSQGGEFRIQGEGMGRGKVGSQKRFEATAEGGAFKKVMEDNPEMEFRGTVAPIADRRRGSMETVTSGSRHLPKPFKRRHELGQVYRVNQVKSLSSQSSPEASPGKPVKLGKSLAMPDEKYPPIGRTDIENYELLVGEFESAADAKMRTR